MTDLQFLERLDQAYLDFTEPLPSSASALVCVLVDHWSDLREEYGYAGLFELRRQVRALFDRHFDKLVDVLQLSESGMVALVQGADSDSLRDASQALFEQLSSTGFELGGDQVAITVSLGFCAFDLRFTEGGQMLTEVVSRTEDLRRQGGNEWLSIVASISAAQASSDHRRMLGLLMQALRNNSIRLVFQTLLSTSGEHTHCFQVLPRLKSADGELIPAARFLPVARSAGLLPTLDRWMLNRVIRLLDERHRHDALRLFVSQSDELLVDGKRRAQFARQVVECGVLADRLVLDFHLADAMAHLKGAEALLALARDHGIGICLSQIDEHSHWSLLSGRLRCDYLRMAPGFVHRLADSNDLEHDLDDLTEKVRAHGTRIIMPMIEDAGAAAQLWGSSIDYLQGNVIQPARESLQLND